MKPSLASSITVLLTLMAMAPDGSMAFVPTLLSSSSSRSFAGSSSSSSLSSSSILLLRASKKMPETSSSSFGNPNSVGPPLLFKNDHDNSAAVDEISSSTSGGGGGGETKKKKTYQPTAAVTTAGTAAAGLALLLSSALVLSPLPATAAMSGGRMGGSFSSRSYSGGGGGGGYSRSYSGGGGGFSGGYSGRSSTTIIAPMPFYSPFYAPPVLYGGGVGALPVVSRGGVSPFDLLLFGGFGFLFLSSLFSNRSTGMMETSWSESATYGGSTALGAGTSVLSLSVAVEVPNRDDPNSLLSVLTRLSQTSNTNDRKGVQNLTSQVALEVLRRKASIQAASSDYQHFRGDNVGQANRLFNKWSVEQRSKFEQENSNVFGGVDRSVKVNRLVPSSSNSNATMAVITLVMAIQGDSTKIPNITNLKSVEEALRKIAADSKVDDCLLSAEILWTPEDRSETLTRQEVIADYPELIDV